MLSNNHASTAGVSQSTLIYANGTQNGSNTDREKEKKKREDISVQCLKASFLCLCGQLMDREIITE